MPPAGAERRLQPRRRLPFRRYAIVEVDGGGRMVSVRDLSRGGAFLESRVPFEPRASFALRLVLPGGGAEARLSCELVRTSAMNGHPMGLAVRFAEVDAETAQLIDRFVEGKREGEQEP